MRLEKIGIELCCPLKCTSCVRPLALPSKRHSFLKRALRLRLICLNHLDELVGGRALHGLGYAAWPSNPDFFDRRFGSKGRRTPFYHSPKDSCRQSTQSRTPLV